jgi:hypothetical protein
VGTGPSNAWPTWTTSTIPGVSDYQRISGNDSFFTYPPAGKWNRFDETLVADNTWYDCRVSGPAIYDGSSQGDHICPEIFAGAAVSSTFVIPTTGIYAITAAEHFTPVYNCDVYLRVTNTIVAIKQVSVVGVPLHDQTLTLYVEHAFTAGTTIKVQHKVNSFGDSRQLDLITNTPAPEISIRYLQRLTV